MVQMQRKSNFLPWMLGSCAIQMLLYFACLLPAAAQEEGTNLSQFGTICTTVLDVITWPRLVLAKMGIENDILVLTICIVINGLLIGSFLEGFQLLRRNLGARKH
jgi:hypothetical protein